MWVVTLRQRGEFEGLREHLESTADARYTRVTTGTGAEIFEAPANSGWPHLALISDDTARLRASAQWIHRQYHPRAIVSSGLIASCTVEVPENPYFIPSICLRSAGRIDINGSPVLYEEIPFDPEIQRQLTQTVVRHPLEKQGRLFGANREILDKSARHWVHANLGCEATDNFTGELQLIGKRFGTRIGCLRVFENAKDSIKWLERAWVTLAHG